MSDVAGDSGRLPASATFSALRVRNFRLLFVGHGVSSIGTWSTLLAQGLLVLELTDDGAVLGLISAFQFLPVLLLSSWTGVLADRHDKLRMTTWLQVLMLVRSAVLCLVATMDQPSVAVICALAGVGGVLTAFDTPCRRALVVEAVPEAEIPSAVNLSSAVVTSSSIVGPLVAGGLILAFGYSSVFALDAVSYIASLVALLRVDRSLLRTPPALPRQRGQIRYGMQDVWRTPDLRLTIAVAAVSGISYNFPVMLPLLVHDVFGRSDGSFTLMYAWLSVGSVLGALSVGRRVRVVGRDLPWGFVRFGLALTVLAALPWFGAALVWGVVIGFAGMSVFTAGVTLAHLACGPRMRGRVMAFHSMAFLGSLAIGAPAIGWLSDVGGPRSALLVSAGFAFAAALSAWFLLERHVPVPAECPSGG